MRTSITKSKKARFTYGPKNSPRVIIIQKLYAFHINKDSEISFSKHRYKKFIKDVVNGTIEKKELIDETIKKHLDKDMNIKRTEKLLIVLLQAAIFEFLYRPKTSINIIINEYLNTAKLFVNSSQTKFLNALLDKISKKIRDYNE